MSPEPNAAAAGDVKPARLPRLIVVTGRPGSGKTTLTRGLSRAVRCPAVCRDEIREGLVNTTGVPARPGDDAARQVFEAFFDTVGLLVGRRITIVAEAAFQHRLWAAKLEALRAAADVRIVVCEVDPLLARARDLERGSADPGRVWFHGDPAVQAAREGRELPIAGYEPPRLDVPTLRVDTSDGYRPGLDAIVGFANG